MENNHLPNERDKLPRGGGGGGSGGGGGVGWRQLSNSELRRPHGVPDVCAAGDVLRVSNLSADAKEFYPKGYQQWQVYQRPSERGDSSRMQMPQIPHTQNVVSHLTDVIHQMTVDPGKFKGLAESLIRTYSSWWIDPNIVNVVIQTLVEHAIVEPNFRYSGARLCHFIISNSTSVLFQQHLLLRCQQETTFVQENISIHIGRAQGFLFFLAELFVQIDHMPLPAHFQELGTCLLSIINALLHQQKSDCVKCVCQSLKLAGKSLDVLNPTSMDVIIQQLVHLQRSKQFDTSLERLIQSVIDLRQSSWGQNVQNIQIQPPQNFDNQFQNDPVLYGPDGQVITAEEREFLQQNVVPTIDNDDWEELNENGAPWTPDDQMDDEIQEAYEEFLKTCRNNT